MQGGAIDVRIKWPNDVYAGPLKLGGILCHSSYRNQLFYVIMGVGLNLSNRQPTTCVDALIEQAAAAPPPAELACPERNGRKGRDGDQQKVCLIGQRHRPLQQPPAFMSGSSWAASRQHRCCAVKNELLP